MKKDINKEIHKLLKIQNQIAEIQNAMDNNDIVFIYQNTYDILPEKILNSDLLFYIIPDELKEYVEADKIGVLGNKIIYVIRNGEYIKEIEIIKE